MYKYSHFPLHKTRESYNTQQQNFLSDISHIGGIVSVYSVGEIDLPGVSDLDYTIIYHGEIDTGIIYTVSKKYSLVDTILFIKKEDLSHIGYLSHHRNYKLVAGEDQKLDFKDHLYTERTQIYIWKFCFTSLLRNYYWYQSRRDIYVKNLLSQIYDIRYPIMFLKTIGVEKELYTQFLQDFSQYRASYFSHSEHEKIVGYLEQAIEISWDIVSEFEKLMPKSEKTGYFYGRFTTYFVEEKYRTTTEKYQSSIGKYSRILALPVSFDYRKWEKPMKEELQKIQKYNPKFLDFSLPGIHLQILLFSKKVFDFISLRVVRFLGREK